MKNRIVIRSPRDCIIMLRRYGRMKQEHFGAIFLNSQKEVIQSKCFFVGSDNVCPVFPKLIFWKACKLEASAIILFHNHPSGNTKPSGYDTDLTQNIVKCGELLGIHVLDHVIIGKYDYFSFLEHDLISQEEKELSAANN